MPIDEKLLTLAQWLSPSYPVGAFAWSHGIETAVRSGWITDGRSLEDWLRVCLTEGSGRADALWLRLAHDGPAEEIDAEARAFAASAERIREAARQGAAFAQVTNAVWGLSLRDHVLPVAVGRAVREAELDVDTALLLYLQSFLTNLVSAAQRLMPLGQTEAQRILAALRPDIADVVEQTRGQTKDDIFSNAFLSDIAAMRHETLEPRLFQS